ncbi:uncharacterized protein LOC102806055 [Saccoglossus kowalevskii]|uniref:Proton-coupled amino acid transporter 1-like n=1 Tax=Saccoglossus kowalevskii TaxID=10224 RepID=A0ABM0MHM0_SACKO|nr:PREDICTED: proton-coupled amino acid transporter 1-like [Saccoglossus kowalevskii]
MHDGGGGTDNLVKIFANIFISFIGAGVLGLPYAFREAGVIEGVLIMACVGVLSVKSMLLIIDSKYRILGQSPHGEAHQQEQEELMMNSVEMNGIISEEEEKTQTDQTKTSVHEIDYGEVGYHAMGTLVTYGRCFCCAYLIFIIENLSSFVHEMHMYQWLFIILPPLAFLTLIRKLHKLAIFSLFADFANVTAYAVVFWFDFEHASKITIHPKAMSFKGFPFFLGISIYCYEGAGMILSLESSVIKEKRHRFRSVFIFTMFVVTSLYIFFGVCGYLSFGAETENIITLNLPAGLFPILVKTCLCFSLYFTYPVMMFPVVKLLEKRLLPDNKDKSYLQGNILRFIMVTVTGLVVLAIPNFSTLMALVGASCCTLLAFILPAIFHLRIFKGSLNKKQLFLDYFLITVGVVGTVIGTWDALKRLFPSLAGTSTVVMDTLISTSPSLNTSVS